jgi:ATP-dependent helicase/nuclease subunit B
MSAVLRFLAGFCREHPLDEKIFIGPSFVTGREIGEALARASGSWVNLRFVTVPALAAEALERRGEGTAAKPMTSSAELALTDRLFRELLAEGKLDYFGRAGASPGLAQALHRAIRELRLDGRTSADVRPDSFLVAQKGRELALLLDRYEQVLESDRLLDLPALLGQAAGAAAGTPFRSAWVLLPMDLRLRRLESELVKSAAAGRLVLVPGDPVAGLERPRQCWPAPAPADLSQAGRLSWLFAPRQAPPPEKEARIDIFRALGTANECREILRRIYDEKLSFDQVEVLAPAGSPHATIFYLLAARTRLPVTFGDGIAASFTSPGRLFFGLAEWLANDFSSDDLCRLLETGDLVLPGLDGAPSAECATAPFAARTACRHLRNAMIGWGRDRYAERLAALADGKRADLAAMVEAGSCEESEDIEDEKAGFAAAIAEIEALSAALGRILEKIPQPDADGAYDFRRLCEAFAALLRDCARIGSDLDVRTRQALLDRLDEFILESRFPALPLKEALGLICSAGTSLRVGASPPLAGRLHVAGLSTGGYSGRQVTFVAGLDEAAFPGRGLQDPVLLDEERTAISASLPTSADGLRSNLFGLAAVLASLPGRVVLSYSSFDIIEGRESFPSSVVLQAFRLLRGDADLDYAALDRSLPEASGFFPGGPGRAFDEAEWWLDRLTVEPRPDGPRSVAANFPGLTAGLAAIGARAGDKLTAYDGIVDIGSVRAVIDPLAGSKAVMSATRLELLAKCPFGYFMRHVLKVQPPEEVAFDRTRWLDPLQRGSLVHEILCEFMTEVAGKREDVTAVRHAGLMDRIAGSHIAGMRLKIPPPSDGIFESERRDILETLAIFMAAEEKRETKGRPLAFEKEIVDEPIALGEGRSFRLRGFIDRVDLIGEDTYRIIDYKTGNPAPYEGLVHFGRGRTLQPALYAVALEQMLARERPGTKPVVAESGYLFPSRRGEGDEIMVRNFDRDRLRLLLNDLIALLQKGYFIAGPDAKCGYCDYRAVCVSGGPESSGAKRDANPEIFKAYDKLDEYK